MDNSSSEESMIKNDYPYNIRCKKCKRLLDPNMFLAKCRVCNNCRKGGESLKAENGSKEEPLLP